MLDEALGQGWPGLVQPQSGRQVVQRQQVEKDVTASGLSEEHIRKAVQEAIYQGLASKNELLSFASRRGLNIQCIIEKSLSSDIK